MKREFIERLIKKIETELGSSKSNLSVENKKKLKKVKLQLESDCDTIFEPATVLSVLQGLAIIVEIMKEISPHLK